MFKTCWKDWQGDPARKGISAEAQQPVPSLADSLAEEEDELPHVDGDMCTPTLISHANIIIMIIKCFENTVLVIYRALTPHDHRQAVPEPHEWLFPRSVYCIVCRQWSQITLSSSLVCKCKAEGVLFL